MASFRVIKVRSTPVTDCLAPSVRSIQRQLLVLLIFLAGASWHGVAGREVCPEENLELVDDHGFFTKGLKVEWDVHHIGWAVAGGAAVVATTTSLVNIYLHCSNYNKPLEQRQIVRILLMPAVYSIVSFFSYRYFREYVYFAVIRDTYEAFVLAAFLILCLLYVGRSPLEQQQVMAQKEKTKLVFPFCCYRYRPSKPYFLIATKWSVMQYVILRPMISAVAIITDAMNLYCGSSYRITFANLWLVIITFTSASVALYGLLVIYHLAKDDLRGHRPMMKFMSIKVAVFLVFYQGFILSFLDRLGYIKPTRYWSRVNISDGMNALATTVEMALIGIFQLFAFPYTEYKALIKGSEVNRKRAPWINFIHSQDYRDFGRDIWMAIKCFANLLRGKPYRQTAHDPQDGTNDLDFQAAFGLGGEHHRIEQVQETFHKRRGSGERKFKALSETNSHARGGNDPNDHSWSPESSSTISISLKSNLETGTYESIQLDEVSYRLSKREEEGLGVVGVHRGSLVKLSLMEGQDTELVDPDLEPQQSSPTSSYSGAEKRQSA